MSRTYPRRPDGSGDIRVRGIRKDPPDLRRLARALIELAQLQAEAEAEQEHKDEQAGGPKSDRDQGQVSEEKPKDAA